MCTGVMYSVCTGVTYSVCTGVMYSVCTGVMYSVCTGAMYSVCVILQCTVNKAGLVQQSSHRPAQDLRATVVCAPQNFQTISIRK